MPADRETATFDYGVPAVLFMAKRKGRSRQPLSYRRFAAAAEAIRFAVEELPAVRALGAWMQVGDERAGQRLGVHGAPAGRRGHLKQNEIA